MGNDGFAIALLLAMGRSSVTGEALHDDPPLLQPVVRSGSQWSLCYHKRSSH